MGKTPLHRPGIPPSASAVNNERRRHPVFLAFSSLAMLGWILFLVWLAFGGT
jgi:hypothetical protein